MSFGRYGVGRLDGKVVMVPAAVPGDLVEVEVVADHKDYLEATSRTLSRASLERRTPPCPYVPRCGGCDWQHINYDAQVRFKVRLVADQISRALNLTLDESALLEPAPSEFGYRSRLRLQIGRRGEVGFNQPGTHNVVAVDSCLVAAAPIQIELTKTAARLFGARLREVELAVDGARQVMTLRLGGAPSQHEIRAARQLLERASGLNGVVLRAGEKRVVIGAPMVTVELEPGLAIEVDADCFSQVNHAQNRHLVALVMELANPRPELALLDLYCGAGNFALPAARRGAKVVGVDADRWAVACAERNRERLGFEGARFLAMEANAAIQFLRRSAYRPSTVILDPPRAGAAGEIEEISELRAERVIYVSCNLPALGRDLRRLSRRGYRRERVRAIDFFPNTHHLEVVACVVLT